MLRLHFAQFTAVALTCFATGSALAQVPADAPVKPEWVYAHDLKVRKGKEADWEKSLKLGVEVYKMPQFNANVVITSSGSIAVVPDSLLPNKSCKYVTGLNVSVRTADEEKFTKDTAFFGIELYGDAFSNGTLFLTEKNNVAVLDNVAQPEKDPMLLYGFKLKARKAGIQSFEKDAKSFGVEVYRDNGTESSLYVTETGAIAVTKSTLDKSLEAKDVKKPKPLYGLEAGVRKLEEPDFTEKTQKLSIDVHQDENTNSLIYLTEAGNIAVVPVPAGMKAEGKFTWKGSATLKARPGGEPDFVKANKYGVEVFLDVRTNYLVFVTTAGTIAVLPRK